jgi:oxygen-independent coproporphyrinogen-3 oxidase
MNHDPDWKAPPQPGERVLFKPDLAKRYGKARETIWRWVRAGKLPVARGTRVSADDVLRRFVINRVMCLLRLDLGEVESRFGREARGEIEASMRGGLDELVADGLVTFDGRVLCVTPLGQLLVRNVAMMFDAYLPRRAGEKSQTFSRTV